MLEGTIHVARFMGSHLHSHLFSVNEPRNKSVGHKNDTFRNMLSTSIKLGSRIQGIEENYIFHCISTMLQQEEQYVCHDYLEDAHALCRGERVNLGNTIVDETCRSKMCEWIFHVIDSTKLQRETASVAMNFLDRFLCAATPRAEQARTSRCEYQLAGEKTIISLLCLMVIISLLCDSH